MYKTKCELCKLNGGCRNEDIYDCVLYIDPNWFKTYHQKIQELKKNQKQVNGITKWLERW